MITMAEEVFGPVITRWERRRFATRDWFLPSYIIIGFTELQRALNHYETRNPIRQDFCVRLRHASEGSGPYQVPLLLLGGVQGTVVIIKQTGEGP